MVANDLTLQSFWSLRPRRWSSPQSPSFLRPPATAVISWMTNMNSTRTQFGLPYLCHPPQRGPRASSNSAVSVERRPDLSSSIPLNCRPCCFLSLSSFTKSSMPGSLLPIVKSPPASLIPFGSFPQARRIPHLSPPSLASPSVASLGPSSQIELLNDPPVAITASKSPSNVSLPSFLLPSLVLSVGPFSVLHSLGTLAGWIVAPGYS